jgi:hypothetical protein
MPNTTPVSCVRNPQELSVNLPLIFKPLGEAMRRAMVAPIEETK